MKPRWTRWLLSCVLAGAALSTLTGAFGIEKEEFECEQAVAHLADCCPDFDARGYICSNGCNYPSGPDIHTDAAECIVGASCDELVKSGACEAPKQVSCR
jgi:hypothetical protein